MSATLPLFEAHPRLRANLPWIPLASLPTPLTSMPTLAARYGDRPLYVKRDDASGRVYGGNKVRKLEFLLGEALQMGAREVITFGTAGSNHALATTVYAREIGLQPISCLVPQTNAGYVARNLMAAVALGGEIHAYGDQAEAEAGARARGLRGLLLTGREPMVIRLGGSSPLGTIGFVNAAYELVAQLEDAGLAPPARIYLPLGTTGTAVGLALGLRSLGIASEVVAVRVVHPDIGNETRVRELFAATNRLLRQADPGFPEIDPERTGIAVRHEYFGEKYAVFTPEGMQAVKIMAETEQIKLEGTYTGKALAAMLADLAQPQASSKAFMYWNTYNSRPLPSVADLRAYRDLPPALHRYFETPPQPLDPERGR